MGLKDTLKDNFTNVRSIQDLKYVDRRILIVGGSILFVVLGIYYYYLIAVYLPHKQAVREAAAAKTAQKQAQQQAQMKKTVAVSMNASMPPSSKVNIPLEGDPNLKKAVDIFKIPKNYMDISKVSPSDSAMYLDTFDVLYDYFNQVFQLNYESAFNYLNKDFVKTNNITLDSFSSYYQNTYFNQNTFYIYSVTTNGTDYIADITINDNEHAGAAFNATYKLINTNGKYSIVIDDLAAFIKSNIGNSQDDSSISQ